MALHRIVLLSLILHCFLVSLAAQSTKALRYFKKGEQAKEKRKPEKARENFLKAAGEDDRWAAPLQELGIMAYRSNKDSLSIHYLEQSTEKSLGFDPRVHHMLGELYMRAQNFKQAATHWQAFLDAETGYTALEKEAQQALDRCLRILEMKAERTVSVMEPLPGSINSNEQEYLPILPADLSFMIFTRRYRAPNDPLTQEDYFISYRKDSSWTNARPIDEINTREPEGGASLSADGNTLLLVRCAEKQGFGSCDLYISFKKEDQWSEPVNLGAKINTAYKERQPAFSPDGNRIYFSSNRPGGLGGMDIWYIDWLPEGRWSEARNMDSLINTPYNERAPYMHYDNQTLYFTSDRPESLGEGDLFRVQRSGKGWGPVNQLPWPINSTGEEGTIYVSIDGRTGYMGKINPDRNNSYDIYTFQLAEEEAAIPSVYIKGVTIDAKSRQPISAYLEVLEKESGTEIARLKTGPSGEFLFTIPKNKEYQFFAEAQGYRYYSRQFNYEDLVQKEDGLQLIIPMEPIGAEVQRDTSPIILQNIFFETASARLKPASETELNHLYEMLRDHPDIQIEIRGHTDDVGSAQANQQLSMQRAKAVYDYLVDKGIDAERLKYEGYGESQPVVPNVSPENRQKNRRVEFLINKDENKDKD